MLSTFRAQKRIVMHVERGVTVGLKRAQRLSLFALSNLQLMCLLKTVSEDVKGFLLLPCCFNSQHIRLFYCPEEQSDQSVTAAVSFVSYPPADPLRDPLLRKPSLSLSDSQHHRPLSSLSFSPKTLEDTIFTFSPSARVDQNKLLDLHSSHFKSGHLTETVLLHVGEKPASFFSVGP